MGSISKSAMAPWAGSMSRSEMRPSGLRWRSRPLLVPQKSIWSERAAMAEKASPGSKSSLPSSVMEVMVVKGDTPLLVLSTLTTWLPLL